MRFEMPAEIRAWHSSQSSSAPDMLKCVFCQFLTPNPLTRWQPGFRLKSVGKIEKKDWKFPKAGFERVTRAIIWELTRQAYRENPDFRKLTEKIAENHDDVWPLCLEEWPDRPYFSSGRKVEPFSPSMFSNSVNLWSITKPEVLYRLIFNLGVKPSKIRTEPVGVVGNAPGLAMFEILGYIPEKFHFYVDIRRPTPELGKSFEKAIRLERKRLIPEICDKKGNLKKGKGIVKTNAGRRELTKLGQQLLDSIGIYRIYQNSQKSVTQTIDWMSCHKHHLALDEKTVRDRLKAVRDSLKSIKKAFSFSGG
jgi:hypothetical protein